jgi:hypothetical protein
MITLRACTRRSTQLLLPLKGGRVLATEAGLFHWSMAFAAHPHKRCRSCQMAAQLAAVAAAASLTRKVRSPRHCGHHNVAAAPGAVPTAQATGCIPTIVISLPHPEVTTSLPAVLLIALSVS